MGNPKTQAMRVFVVDDGAKYWIAATGCFEAFDVYREHVCDEPDDGFKIDELHEAAARKVTIHDDADAVTVIRDAWSMAQAATEPTFLGCSEW